MHDICPRCKSNMKTDLIEVMGMPVKGCSKCGGFIADFSGSEQLLTEAITKKEANKLGKEELSDDSHKELLESCPVCDGKFESTPLNFELIGDTVHLDQCSGCGGIWFDKGELKEIFDMAMREAVAVGSFGEDLDLMEGCTDTKFDCPRCNSEQDASEGEILDMNVTKCKKCLGVWVADGQLDNMLGDVKSFKVSGKADKEIHSSDEGIKPAEGYCPKCHVALTKWENMPESLKDLYVDYCNKCSGLWFDEGEFSSFFRIFSESPFQKVE